MKSDNKKMYSVKYYNILFAFLAVLFFCTETKSQSVTIPIYGVPVAYTASATYTLYQSLYNGSNAYYVSVAGTSGTVAPTHTSGSIAATGGTASFTYIGTYSAGLITWVCPAGVLGGTIQVEAWGGGGGGGGTSAAANYSGGGGAGGSYAKHSSISVTASNSYNITIGAGGNAAGSGSGSCDLATDGLSSTFSGSGITTLTAIGGARGRGASSTLGRSGAGGASVTSGNTGFTVSYYGGAGSIGSTTSSLPAATYGGAGGGAAGSTANGGNASTSNGGTGISPGANGASGPTTATGANGNAGSTIGGGGSGGVSGSGTTGRTGGKGGDGAIIISYILSPNLSYSPTSLSGFAYNSGSGPSAVQSFSVGANDLTTDLTISAPNYYEVSTSSTGPFSSSISLTQSAGSIAATTIYVRLKSGLFAGSYNENISMTSTAASGNVVQTIACSGTVTGPIIYFTPSSLSYFNSTPSVASASQTISVSASNLTAPLTITAPANFLISTDNVSFSNSVVLFPSGGTVPASIIYIQLLASANGTYKQNITFTSTGAAPKSLRCIGFVRSNSPSVNVISPVSLQITGLDYNLGFGPSTPAKNFSFTAFYLKDTSITVTSKLSNIEFSTDSLNFFNSFTFLADSLGNVSNQIVYVRLKAGLAAATYNDSSIINSVGSGATYTKRILCQGIVFPNAFINEPATLTRFIYYSGTAGPSTLQRIPIKATTLGTNSLTVALGSNSKYEFYTASDPTYTSVSKSLTPVSGTVSDTIYIRLKSGQSVGNYIDTITLSTLATGATSRKVACSGNVVAETVYTETFYGSSLGSAGTSYYSNIFTNAVNYGDWTRANVGSSNNSIWTPTNTSVCAKFKTLTTSFIQTPKIPGVNNIYFSVAESVTGITDSLTVTDGGSLNSFFKYTAAQIVPSYYSSTNTISPSATTTDQYKFTFPSLSGTHYLDNIIFTFKKPSTQDSAITVGHSATADTIKWKRPVNSNGNRNQGCLVFIGKGAFTNPTSGVSYSPSATYGLGSQIGNYFCVHNDTTQSVVVTGLNSDSLYNIYVLEYNGIKGQSDENYNTTNIAFNTTRPTATISGTSQNIKCGDNFSVSISVTGTGPWSGTLSDGTTFSGNVSPIIVTLNPNANTTYSLTSITDYNYSNVTSNLAGSPVNATITTAVWKGTVSNAWDNSANWCGGSVPASTTIISIPNVSNLPIISSNGTVKDLTIETGASVTINDGGKLTVTGNFVLNGAITNNGILSFSGSGNQTFSGNNGMVIFMDSIEVDKAKVAGDTMIFSKSFAVSGALIPTSGNIKLNNDTITLSSNIAGTASVGNATGATIIYSANGKFTVERYFPSGVNHSKTWQLLSVPTFGQTIREAWMEGATSSNANPKSGYGTQTVGSGGWTNGFDVSSSLPSIKTYNPSYDTWTGITSTNNTIANANGYMIFVRGDRTVTNSSSNSNATVLRTTGKIYSPSNAPSNVVVPAGKFQTIGNPYASAIDFIDLSNSNPGIDKYFYVWDPLFSGTYGGYRLFSLANGWDDGESTSNYNSANTLIQSGQAVFVHNSGTSDVTLSFSENNKVSGSRMTFRPPTAVVTGLRTFIKNAGNKLVDGTLLAINSNYSNSYESNDAIKLFNTNENISIVNNNKTLAIDARANINAADTVFYQLNNLTNQQYQFVFSPENMMPLAAGMQAYLIDQYSNSRTSLSLIDSTFINFDVNADLSSHDPSRFYLVFKTSRALPVRFINVFASRKENKSVSITWDVDNESNIKSYQIERSIDGVHFEVIGSVNQVLNNGNASTYSYLDSDITTTEKIYYRIRSNEISGACQLSKVVQLYALQTNNNIKISPNPIAGDYINAYFNNQQFGNYNITVLNPQGQIVVNKVVSVKSKSDKHQIAFGKKFASGKYLLKVCDHEGIITTINFLNP